MVGRDGGRVDPAAPPAQDLDDPRLPLTLTLAAADAGGGVAATRWRDGDDLAGRRLDPRVEAPAPAREEVAHDMSSGCFSVPEQHTPTDDTRPTAVSVRFVCFQQRNNLDARTSSSALRVATVHATDRAVGHLLYGTSTSLVITLATKANGRNETIRYDTRMGPEVVRPSPVSAVSLMRPRGARTERYGP